MNSFYKSIVEKMSYVLSNKLALVILFTLLTVVSAKIFIPLKPVPFTLQTLVVLLSGAFLGKKLGFSSQVLYLSLGAIGLPVFAPIADGTFGFASIIGPTGGYLLMFPFAAYITGVFVEKTRNVFILLLTFLLGELLIIFSGISFLYTFYLKDLDLSLYMGGYIFFAWTLVKVVLATLIIKKMK